MKAAISAVSLLVALALAGCEQAADISSPTVYEKNHVGFSFPANWDVSEDATQDGVRHIFVESPGDAIFIALLYPRTDAVSLREFAEWFSAQAGEETPVANVGESAFSDLEKASGQLSGEAIGEDFSLSLLGMEIPHRRGYYTTESGDRTAFLVTQVANDDLGKVQPGFDLILGSFVLE